MGDQDCFIAAALPIVRALCIKFEGVYLAPYLDPIGIATIAVGATYYEDGTRVTLRDPPVTRERAMQLLDWHLTQRYVPQTLALCPAIDTPGRLAALSDFALNCGTGALRASTLRRRIAAARWDDVPTELRRWTRGGGRVLRGLDHRREAEAALI